MPRIIDGKTPRRPRFWLYLSALALIGVMIAGSRAMTLMERDALWIGKTRVFPPWYHKTIRLSETHSSDADSWVDFTVGTFEDFYRQGHLEGQMYSQYQETGSGVPPRRSPLPLPSSYHRDPARQGFVFHGARGKHGGGTTGHNSGGGPARDFGFEIKQVFGFYLVTADPAYASGTTGALR